MKKSLLFAALATCSLSVLAQSQLPSSVSPDGNDINIKSPVTLELLEKVNGKMATNHEAAVSIPNLQSNRQAVTAPQTYKAPNPRALVDGLPADTLTFTSFQQSFYNGYSFNYESGDIKSYQTQVVFHQDNTVTFISLLDLNNHATSYACGDVEAEINGMYNPETHMITINTPAQGTPGCGLIYNYYPGVIRGGEASENGGFSAADKLEFTVAEDFSSIETVQNIVILYEYYGSYYAHTAIKFIKMFQPAEGQKLISFTGEDVPFNESTFPTLDLTKKIVIANIGNQAAEYVTDCASEGDAFSLSPATGQIEPMELGFFELTFCPQAQGQYEGVATVAFENQEFLYTTKGTCEGFPDYSPIVTEGEFTFKTGKEFPFGIQISPEVAAYSSNWKAYGDSWLQATVQVPAGKIATVSWTGHSYSTYYFASKTTILDEKGNAAWTDDISENGEYIDGSYKFAEGEHSLTFNFNISYATYVQDEDQLVINSLKVTYQDVVDDLGVQTEGDNLKFGNFIEGTNSATLSAVIRNEGSNPLKVTGKTEGQYFKVYNNDEAVQTLEYLKTPVEFIGSEAGEYAEDIVLNTTAGDFTFHCTALVRAIPDFSKILSPDCDPAVTVTWSYSTTDPFVIDPATNEAVNCTAKELDEVASTSWFQANLEVPSGKRAIVTWDATLDMDTIHADTGTYSDYATVSVQHPSGSFMIIRIGTQSLCSDTVYATFDPNTTAIADYMSGTNAITWSMYHGGDSFYSGEDEFRISNLKITLEDFPAYRCELSDEVIDFGQMLQGRTISKTVTLTNTGSEKLGIDSIAFDGPVSIDYIPSWTIGYKSNYALTFKFDGAEPGEYEGAITLYTTAGDVIILYTATVESTEQYLLAEDFENGADNWYTYDADGDGKNWDTLWSLFGGYPQGHCHSGENGIGSTAYYYYSPDLDPDNWAISNYFEIPAEGEYELSWWVGVEDSEYEYCNHTYQVRVGEDMTDRLGMDVVFEETLDQTGWQERKVNLKEYAGKTVSLAFRHYNSKGMYLLKIDDVFVSPVADPVSIQSVQMQNAAEVYGINGMRQQGLTNGLNIVRRVAEDGSVVVEKVIK